MLNNINQLYSTATVDWLNKHLETGKICEHLKSFGGRVKTYATKISERHPGLNIPLGFIPGYSDYRFIKLAKLTKEYTILLPSLRYIPSIGMIVFGNPVHQVFGIAIYIASSVGCGIETAEIVAENKNSR